MNSQSQDTLDPGLAQKYIFQVSEEFEGRVTRNFSKEFSRTELRLLGALSKLDEFLLNQQARTFPVAVPGTSKNNDLENRKPTGDRYLCDPCPERVFSTYHSTNPNDPEQEETHHMVTGVQQVIPYRPHMATGVQEEIPYCSPGTSSRKQKKALSTNQPQSRSGNTPATIEADQVLQQTEHGKNTSNISQWQQQNTNLSDWSSIQRTRS